MEKKIKRTNTIYKKVKLFINISAAILALFFTWLQFDISLFKPFFTDEWANILFKLSLVLYYFSWIFGTTADLKDEDYTLNIYPNKNEISKISFGILLFLVLLFALLCFINTASLFAIVLSGFLIFNVISWRYLVHFAKPTFKENENIIKNKFDYEYQKVLENYLMGRWQWYRFIYAVFFIIVINILIFSDLHLFVAAKLHCSSQFIISICFLFYVVTFELWVWFKRIERILTFRIYDKLDDIYMLNLKSNEK
jgi:hypothetical protein